MAEAQLPQDHSYQQVLRNYLGTMTVEDFKVDLKPLEYNASYFSSADELYRVWLLRYDRGRELPSTIGIRRPAQYFTLDAIESGGKVNMTVGRGRYIPPVPTIWWNNWSYEGNPYHDNRSIRNRAFVAAAVDMMMLDQAHEAGKWKRSDYLGTHLIWYGYVYQAVKNDLPANVQSAFETGMRKMFSKAESWGSHGVHADMDLFAVVGMWYIAKSIGDPNLMTRAKAYASTEVFGTWTKKWTAGLYHPAGFIDHGGGFDPSYQGITLFFSIWAALASDDPDLQQRVEEMSKLKAYLSLPEPGTDSEGEPHFYSPSHFATATTLGSANDQWAPYSRDVGAAMLTDEAKYLVWGGRERLHWETYGIPDQSTMHAQISGDFQRANSSGHMTEPSGSVPSGWDSYDKKDRWTPGLIAAATYYRDGFYEEMRQLQQQNSPLTKAPFKRDGNFIENFNDTFLSAKFGNYGVIIHTGNLSWWGDEQNLAGLGGGSLSAFWTAGSGSVLLGQKAGYEGYNREDPDVWNDWRQWPTHAISGVNTQGQPFSSARQKKPEEEYQIFGTDSARVEVSGSLSGSFPAPNQALTGSVTYHRSFRVTSRGVTITSEVEGDGTDKVAELYEMIPILLKHDYWDNNNADATIEFRVNGTWQKATTSFVKATAIRITRLGKPVFINFKQSRRIKLSPQDWTTSYKLDSRQRNIMVDLLDNGGSPEALTSATTTYIMSENDVEVSSGSGPSNVNPDGNEDTTPPEATVVHSPSSPDNSQKISLTASASDDAGIEQINIFWQGESVKTCPGVTKCVYEVGAVSDGNYQYHATATDNNGNTTELAVQELTVETEETATDTTPPSVNVSINPQKPNDTQKITLTAEAEDASGIEKIDIYIEEKLEKTCTDVATCKLSGGPFAAGEYSYQIVAVDKAAEPNTKRTDQKFLTIVEFQEAGPNSWPVVVEKPKLVKASEELHLSVTDIEDEDGDSVFTNIDWRLNGNSIALVNYSFDVKKDSLISDFSTYQHDGRLGTDSFKPDWIPSGKKSGAYRFDGEDDYIYIPTSKSVETLSALTLEAWINHEGWGNSWATIVSKPFYKEKWEDPWSLFKLGRDGPREQLNFQVAVGEGKAVSIQSKADIPANTWTHVVATYDGHKLKLYINGKLDNEMSVEVPLMRNRSTGLYLGTKWGRQANAEAYQGMIDEFRLFGRALTEAQIHNHYVNSYSDFAIQETAGGQAWSATITPTDMKTYGQTKTSNTVKIKKVEAAGRAAAFSLAQNYPNPFQLQTTITYTLPEDHQTEVSLWLYNILGKKVATLVDHELQSGPQSIMLDASALDMTSGIYFYQLKAGDRTFSKKMTFIK